MREGRFGEITEILAWYEYINDVILDHLDDEIKSTNKSGVWRYLISFKVGSDHILIIRQKGIKSLNYKALDLTLAVLFIGLQAVNYFLPFPSF